MRVKADRVVNGKLSRILPIIDGKPHKRSFPSANDFVREDIHASGFFMPVIASLIGVPAVGILIFIIALIYTISELRRLEGKRISTYFSNYTSCCFPIGTSWLRSCATLLCFWHFVHVIVFPHPASYAAIAMFCFGDSDASLFGGLIIQLRYRLTREKPGLGSLCSGSF